MLSPNLRNPDMGSQIYTQGNTLGIWQRRSLLPTKEASKAPKQEQARRQARAFLGSVGEKAETRSVHPTTSLLASHRWLEGGKWEVEP